MCYFLEIKNYEKGKVYLYKFSFTIFIYRGTIIANILFFRVINNYTIPCMYKIVPEYNKYEDTRYSETGKIFV